MRVVTLLIFSCFIAFKVFAIPPVVSSFSPVSAVTGMTITITGSNFTNVSGVTFGGVAATSFNVVSSTSITAVVGTGSSGAVQVTNVDGTGSRAGFTFVYTSAIFTDFGGFWSASGAAPNSTVPDDSHNLLGFTYNGVTYSTGVNNNVLTSRGISFTPGNYRALPVAGISGVTGSTSTYLALAKKVDGSATVASTPSVAHVSVRDVLIDGPNGLNLGTGVTNLPTAATMTFQIFNINPSKVADNEPDIILTQIAQPVTGNDTYSFIDASGVVVGTPFSQDMTLLPKFGSYDLDLFNLSPSTPFNNATAYSAFSTNTNREIRLVGLQLSDFGITAANVAQVKALRVTPSGNSDYAFIAYNANAINLPPNVSQNLAESNTTICGGGTANMQVEVTAASGGALSYSWEQSTDNGASWATVTNGGVYSGSTTGRLLVANASNGYRYRALVQEAGNPISATSSEFIIALSAPAPPSAVTVSGGTSVCLNSPVQLTSTVTGGSNLYYQWQSNASGSYQNISDGILSSYIPAVNETGSTSYRLSVSSGSGCPGITSAPATVTITGISSVTPAARCATGSVTLTAAATAGTIDWYNVDAGGSPVQTGTSFVTPSISATRTYYVASSGCASALRVPVLATVHPTTVGGSVAGTASVPPGINSTQLTVTGNVGEIVKWQSSSDNFNLSITDIPQTTNELQVTNINETTQFRTEIKSGTCASVFSTPATISMMGTLPIRNTSLKATEESNGVMISWIAYSQQSTTAFEIEKSVDGQSYLKVNTTVPVDITNPSVNYEWLDRSPASGINYYRIKEVFKGGKHAYSSIVFISYTNNTNDISFYPNPGNGQNLQVLLSNMEAGLYQLRLMNNAGQVINKLSVNYEGGQKIQPLQLKQKLGAGVYRLEISGPKNFRTVKSVSVF